MTFDHATEPGETDRGTWRVNIVVEFRVDEEVAREASPGSVPPGANPRMAIGVEVADTVTAALRRWEEVGLHPEGTMYVHFGEGDAFLNYPTSMAKDWPFRYALRERGAVPRPPLPPHTIDVRLEVGEEDAHIRFNIVAPEVPWHVDEVYLRPGWGSQVEDSTNEDFERVTLLENSDLTEDFTSVDSIVPASIVEGEMYSIVIVDALGIHHHPCPGRPKA